MYIHLFNYIMAEYIIMYWEEFYRFEEHSARVCYSRLIIVIYQLHQPYYLPSGGRNPALFARWRNRSMRSWNSFPLINTWDVVAPWLRR